MDRARRGVKTNRMASVVIRGHAFIQRLRRGHDELAVDTGPLFRLATEFDELRSHHLPARAPGRASACPAPRPRGSQRSRSCQREHRSTGTVLFAGTGETCRAHGGRLEPRIATLPGSGTT